MVPIVLMLFMISRTCQKCEDLVKILSQEQIVEFLILNFYLFQTRKLNKHIHKLSIYENCLQIVIQITNQISQNPIRFTAAGFFVVNFQLMAGVSFLEVLLIFFVCVKYIFFLYRLSLPQ